MRFLRILLKKSEVGEAVDVERELLTKTNNTISRMTMSQLACSEADHEAEDIRKLVADTAEQGGRFRISDFVWFFKNFDLQRNNKRAKEVPERFDNMMERVIKEHEEERRKMEGEVMK